MKLTPAETAKRSRNKPKKFSESFRIHSETHPTRFSVPRFPVRFVGLSPENRIFEKSKIRNFFRSAFYLFVKSINSPNL